MNWILDLPMLFVRLTTSPLLQGCGVVGLAVVAVYLLTNMIRRKRWYKVDN